MSTGTPVKRIVTRAEMVDGTIHEAIRPIIADQVAYSRARMKHKGCPGPTDDIMFYAAFQTWSALRRTGDYEGSWDAFGEECSAIEVVDVGEDVDPTM